MNTPIIILFLASAVAYSYAAVAIFLAEPKPAEFADQEGCYLSVLNRVLPYETPYVPDGKCEEYTCHRNNETQLFTCGAVAVPPNCHATSNKQLKYPDCCKPIIVCNQTTIDPTTEAATTTVAPTTEAATTTVAPTTEAANTTEAASTTSVPPTPEPQSSSASAYASSQSGSPPVVQASATPGASAVASAS